MTELVDHPDRHLPWEACRNARDTGGYPACEGTSTRWRALVRADNLCRLSPEGSSALVTYGVRTVIDLRRPSEIESAPHPFAPNGRHDGPTYFNINVDGTDEAAITRLRTLSSMQALYADMLESGRAAYAEVVTTIARAPEGGVLVHCHAGKDRTGLVVALLLALAGVPAPVIVADYALSDRYLQPLYAEILDTLDDAARRERATRWLHSHADAMHDTLVLLVERYGGAEGYLRAAGVSTNDLARVRERLVAAVSSSR